MDIYDILNLYIPPLVRLVGRRWLNIVLKNSGSDFGTQDDTITFGGGRGVGRVNIGCGERLRGKIDIV